MTKSRTKSKKKYILMHIIVWGLIIVTGTLLLFSYIKRVEYGYFNNPRWIFLNSLLYVIFFGLISGYVIGNILGFTKKLKIK